VFLGQSLGSREIGVTTGDELGVGNIADRAAVKIGDQAGADDSEVPGFHVLSSFVL
jgi:hypothetical protein